MNKILVDELFLTIVELADLAAEISKKYFRKNIGIEYKDGTYPVTVVDREIETCLRERIKKIYPTHGIIGEEFANHNADKKYIWVIDPIDGTAAFTTGKPTFTTLIALLEDDKPAIGIIDQAVLGDRFMGIAGQGAWFNGARLAVSEESVLSHARLNATTPYMFKTTYEKNAFERVRKEVRLTAFGSDSYAYGLLAAGYIDIIMEADLGYYDVAALIPIINGSGGVITDWQGNELNSKTFTGQCLASATHKLHDSILKIIGGWYLYAPSFLIIILNT